MEMQSLFEQVSLEFKNIQAKNISKFKTYPHSLQDQAVRLLDHYSIKTLASAFKITVKTLQNWRRTRKTDTKKHPTLMPLIIAEDKSFASPSIMLKLPHNLELMLHEQSAPQIAQLIGAIILELNSCSI